MLGEVIVLDDTGPARRGRAYPNAWTALALLLPVALLLGGFVLWPILRTLIASVTDAGDGGLEFVGLEHFRDVLDAEDAWRVIGRTLLWAVVVPAVVTVLGYALAVASQPSRRGRLSLLVLVTPVAIPLVVTGVAFRLMYEGDPERAIIPAMASRLFGEAPVFLGPGLITVSLMSAFVWAWIGLAVMLFRAALAAIPQGLSDVVHAHGGTRWNVFHDAQWQPLLRRTVAVVFAFVAVGTARSFDLILIMAPGSVWPEASVLALRVWQTSGASTTGPGAALGVIWLAAVAVGAAVAALGIRQPWPAPFSRRSVDSPTTQRPVTSASRRAVCRAMLILASIAWILPLTTLVATSLHSPTDAATRGWWTAAVRLDSYQGLLERLPRSLGFTLLLATAVTVVVLVVAVLAAHPLAWLAGSSAQGVSVLLLAAAVVPIQVIAGPVNAALAAVGLAGSAPGLALVHVALGAPFAVLVLRNAFADLPAAEVRRARLSGRGELATVWRLVRRAAPTVVAVGVLQFVKVWNDLAVGLLFSGPDAPVGLLLYGEARQFVVNSGPLAASSVIVSILPVLLVVLTRRHVVAGLVTGVVK
ncbi:MAG: ABC transporter permease subunit [Micromonosporaceae bacterium]|nr:ABC transporter permease subunit [Micromonosporaceae bacterium]